MPKLLVDIDLPAIPNFVKVGGSSRDIADLNEITLRELGKEWVEALVLRARDRRTARAVP